MTKTTKEIKKKKKRWVSLFAAASFDNLKLGESLVEEPAQLVGRTIKVNLMTLVNDPKKQHVHLVFKLVQVKGDVVEGDVTGYEVSNAFVKRMVRKGNQKIEDSFIAVSKEGKQFVVKPLFVVRHKVKGSVGTSIRKTVRAFLTEAFKDEDKETIFHAAISNKIQSELRSLVKKIYPVAACELKVLKTL